MLAKAIPLSMLILALVSQGAPTDRDMRRAVSKIPGSHLRGKGFQDMVLKLNKHLDQTNGLVTAPCSDFTVSELQELQRVLYAARDPKFEEVYQDGSDNRRLGAFGRLTSDLDELEKLWRSEREAVSAHSALHDVARDAKCHEVVMWFIHHLTDATKREMSNMIKLPLLALEAPHTIQSLQKQLPASLVHTAAPVFESYSQGIGCSACHASGATAGNSESKVWPESLSYNATGYGAFPFWDNTGPGCTYCNPAITPGQKITVKYSAKFNSEMLLHSKCGDMSWTGAKNAPNATPCNHLFNADEGAFIYTPNSPLSPIAASGNDAFCCRSYKAKDSQFPGAVPNDWMRSMTLYHNHSGGDTVQGFKGDYYTGDIKYYWSQGVVQFWYIESKDGLPVEQGEGCYQPGVKPKYPCGYQMPIVLYHDYDPATFKATDHTKDEFAVPDVCKNTVVDCSGPGGDSQSQYRGTLSVHARMAGVGSMN